MRALRRAPAFTLVAALTLAVGIGASAAVFTVANAILIKGLPYIHADRLVAIQFRAPIAPSSDALVPSPALAAWTTQSRSLESVAAYTLGEMPFALPGGEPVRVQGASISPTLLTVLGVGAVQMGRAFGPEDAVRNAPRVAMVSYSFWRDRLSSAQDLTSIRLSSGTTVIGVLPESFRFPDVISPDVFRPLVLPDGDVVATVRVIARLRSGASADAAESELRAITASAASSFPSSMAARMQQGSRPSVVPLQQHLASDLRPVLLVAIGVALLILLIACANVAGLLLARTKARQRELAIRIALGGTSTRLVRLVLTESAVLTFVGGGAALLTIQWSLAVLRQTLATTAPHAEAIAVDASTAAFTLFAALVSAFLCAAIPVGRVLADSRRWDWKFGAGSVTRFARGYVAGRTLVVAQVSAAVVLLVGALLLLGTLWRLTTVDVGFDPRNVLTFRVPGWLGNWPRPREATLDEILLRLRALPGVESAGATTAFPLDGHGFGMGISVEGHAPASADEPGIGVDVVSPGYFNAMRIAIRSGRDFETRDTPSAPRVAVVNEAFVRWKKLDHALGRRIGFGGDPQYATIEIVGVVEDVKDKNPGDDVQPIVYRPFHQAAPNIGWGAANIVVRTAEDSSVAAVAVRQTIASVVTGAVVYDVQPMERRIAALVAPQRQRAWVFGLFGVTAVVLAAVGLYGLLAYVVSQEMREFGIRLAIGASRGHIAALVLRRGLVSASVGLGVGVLAAQLLTRRLESLLYGVTAADPATYAVAAAIMLFVAAVASYLPARRAMRADPLESLRSE